MNTNIQQLSAPTKAFFDKIAKNYFSENEKKFFESLKEKIQREFTYANDLIISEHDNEENLYMVRHYFDEFEIGRTGVENDFYAMTFQDAMLVNLEDVGLLEQNMTMLEWLRSKDYECVRYDGNFDNL